MRPLLCVALLALLSGLLRVQQGALDAAEAVMRKHRTGPVTSISLSCNRFGFSAYAHDKLEAFTCDGAAGKSLADRLQHALNKVHDANPDEETRKAKRIADLREQLSRLEGEAA